MIKYSFLLTYYKRADLFYNSLISYRHHYSNRNDYEIIIIEDIKSYNDINERCKLTNILNKFNDLNIIRIRYGNETEWNPVKLINKGSEIAKGEYFIITGPEMFHCSNILKGFDDKVKSNIVISGSCITKPINEGIVNNFYDFKYIKDNNKKNWWVHSILKPKSFMLYFILCINRYDFFNLKGCDEQYSQGIAYDDLDFKQKIINSCLVPIVDDELIVVHQHHLPLIKYIKKSNEEIKKLKQLNKSLFSKKWGKKR